MYLKNQQLKRHAFEMLGVGPLSSASNLDLAERQEGLIASKREEILCRPRAGGSLAQHETKLCPSRNYLTTTWI